MHVQVVRLFEDGKQIPRWQYSYLKPVFGELRLQQSRDEYLNRHMRSAHLLDDEGPINQRRGEKIPPLIDAAILWISGQRMTISGFERSELLATYAQTWLVEVIAAESR